MNVARYTLQKNFRKLYSIAVRDIHVSCVNRNINDAKVIDNQMTRVTWDDNETCDFPHIFLRDNCQCSTCFHPDSKQRLLDTVKTIDLNIQPKEIQLDKSNADVTITWPDEHVSKFSSKWLKKRKFPNEGEKINSTIFKDIKRITWSSKYIKENMPYIEYDDLMKNDKTLVQHFENLISLGLSIIKSAPAESGVLNGITDKMTYGYMKKTHYGETFTVRNKPSPNNLAYTAGYLPLHVDLPFMEYQPGIQLLHCIEQSDGDGSGVNHLSDGFNTAERLKEQYPDYFDLLSTVKFKFNDIGWDIYGEFNKELERPVIGLDDFGVVQSVSYNNHVRSSFVNASSKTVFKSYEAFYACTRMLYSEVLEYKMKPGDIMVFNNKRVVHGRTQFDPTTTTRWLEGCYFDWDEVASIYRVAKARLNKDK